MTLNIGVVLFPLDWERDRFARATRAQEEPRSSPTGVYFIGAVKADIIVLKGVLFLEGVYGRDVVD